MGFTSTEERYIGCLRYGARTFLTYLVDLVRSAPQHAVAVGPTQCFIGQIGSISLCARHSFIGQIGSISLMIDETPMPGWLFDTGFLGSLDSTHNDECSIPVADPFRGAFSRRRCKRGSFDLCQWKYILIIEIERLSGLVDGYTYMRILVLCVVVVFAITSSWGDPVWSTGR